ncbi:4638_t:CDS:1, partial [Entrophospora sp. SA101]
MEDEQEEENEQKRFKLTIETLKDQVQVEDKDHANIMAELAYTKKLLTNSEKQ